MGVTTVGKAFRVPSDPPVSVERKLQFYVWVVTIGISQAWRDLKAWKWYRPLQLVDLAGHYFYAPIGRMDPRILLSAPNDRVLIKTIPHWMSQDYDKADISSCPEREVVNAGSNNYGGFTRFEYGSSSVIKLALRHLPFNPAPPELNARVEKELAEYMGAEACATAISGYGANLLAFQTFGETAKRLGRQCIFLLDEESHSSMFTGAFLNKGARFHRFRHNDIGDLEYKLRVLKQTDPDALICVAIEGMYSLAGNVAPVPAILALRRIYKFCFLVDEAHSFMALGRGGRGSFEWWQARGYDCPLSEVDIMTATLSKSVGCTGGFVVANGIYSTEVQRQATLRLEAGAEMLSTVVLVRALTLIHKPAFIERRMATLENKARFVCECLAEAGCLVLSPPGSPIICFPVGTIQQASYFHAESLRRGFAIACGVPPATPIWACRIRVCIFATTSWSDILGLVNTLIAICCKLKISGVQPMVHNADSLPKEEPEDIALVDESTNAEMALKEYVMKLAAEYPAEAPEAITPLTLTQAYEVFEAGVQTFEKYGVGASSVRWFYGTFDVFIKLERRLAGLYPSLISHSGPCRGKFRGIPQIVCHNSNAIWSNVIAMLGADFDVMAISLLSAATNPLYAKDVLNLIFIPRTAPLPVRNGATLDKPKSLTQIIFYDNPETLAAEQLDLGGRRYHLTLYLGTVDHDGSILDLSVRVHSILSGLKNSSGLEGLKLILDDSRGLGKIGPQYLGFLDEMESRHGSSFFETALGSQLSTMTTVVCFGSWFDSFRHQGGYLIGGEAFMESHTVSSKSFVFSTPPMIVQAAMSDKTLELLSSQAVTRGQEVLKRQKQEYLAKI
ncbi:hypothetical protein G7Z17_g7228 [Cylindrodendrum hubeiense]|uniref:Aminotransferase class I/classII large domain-containing protein n=1 Tax=Cylindrodendrum hubeiense TaxID=595255 RepID=A0A9P5HAV5_9HYPO|nr:hypothetical protein G7Z17_g7228 [Cylindrodendrum hubeiense]